jgi:cytoskeletal protein CcmA (bactofilin family)/anti-sigma factor RsiW
VTCPTPWILSMHADEELPPDEANALMRHARDCNTCTTALAALVAERNVLCTALRATQGAADIPAFVPPASRRNWFALVLAVAATGIVIDTFWGAVAAVVPSGLRWLNPFAPGELVERALHVVTFIVYEGNTMWTAALNAAGLVSLFALLAAGVATLGRRSSGPALLASLLVAAFVAPLTSHAFEIRRGEIVALPAGETVDDTLLVAGETIAIDGDVTGDLLAFGRNITVRGNVGGDLVTGGETVTVEGTVGGNVIGGARALALLGTGIVGNVYGGGRDVEVGGNTAVGGNAIAFGENVKIDGRVGRDLKGFGSRITIGGSVEGNVEGFAENVTLLSSARVGGDVLARVESTGDLRIAPGAVIGGRTEETIGADRSEAQPNRYLTVGFYVREIVGLAAAYVTGLLLLAAFPALRSLVLPDATAVLRSGGIGLVVAIVLPIAALIACITVIGIPIGLLVFVLGAIGLYFGKTVVAQIVGTALFRGPQGVAHFAATLLAGLVIVRVAINLPIVGGIANVVLTLVGFGLIVSVLYARLQRGPLS